jgi:hypothetical protein
VKIAPGSATDDRLRAFFCDRISPACLQTPKIYLPQALRLHTRFSVRVCNDTLMR